MSVSRYLASTVVRKFIAGLTGVLLILYLILHLAGNLTLFAGPDIFNWYAGKLESFGALLWVVEIALALVFVFHAIIGVQVFLGKRRARPNGYAVSASRGEPSRQTLSSRSMIITGIVLAVFIPVHVWMFKFRPTPSIMVGSHEVRDLYALVITAFKQPLIAWSYVLVMGLLGFHLRHGFWSAFQSMGALNPRLLPLFYSLGVVVAILLAGGFLVLPLWLLYGVQAPGM
ncbi:MAG TPA: succinate dehydrogenase cytochrome b subunit [Candidatus Krumholzibacteria bacterium]|nr:succinate dehydrogenase cytochrome b subunit [Candidatus Krumholzibacteria bacterium]